MNKITKLHEENPMPIKVGNIYASDGEYYILFQIGRQFSLVNLKSGSSFDGLKNSAEESFSRFQEEFSLVTAPIVLTPEN